MPSERRVHLLRSSQHFLGGSPHPTHILRPWALLGSLQLCSLCAGPRPSPSVLSSRFIPPHTGGPDPRGCPRGCRGLSLRGLQLSSCRKKRVPPRSGLPAPRVVGAMAPNLFSASLGKQVSLCQRRDKNISVCLALSGPSRQEEEACLLRHGPRVAAFLSGQRGLVGGRWSTEAVPLTGAEEISIPPPGQSAGVGRRRGVEPRLSGWRPPPSRV